MFNNKGEYFWLYKYPKHIYFVISLYYINNQNSKLSYVQMSDLQLYYDLDRHGVGKYIIQMQGSLKSKETWLILSVQLFVRNEF